MERTEAELAFLDACASTGVGNRPYSGRSMNGKRCLGIVFQNDKEMRRFIALTMHYADVNFHEEIIEFFESSLLDDMGKSIILYFPQVEMD